MIQALSALPSSLNQLGLELSADGKILSLAMDRQTPDRAMMEITQTLLKEQLAFKSLQTIESSLEEIFIDLLKDRQ